MTDTDYMRLALKLAAKGEGKVSPNPLVGAVIVKNGRVIGQGYHGFWGGPHAERAALASLTVPAEGADLYVTLEPCCHYGKTPPCTDAILQSGIRRVVIGAVDPNPLVAGKGIGILKQHGIHVSQGVLENECIRQNQVFFHYILTGRPYVVMKYAMTMDGKTATFTRKSQWITGDEARAHVHKTRNRLSAVMTGTKTVLEDDPHLTCRRPEGRNPIRIICDTHLSTPLTSNVVRTASRVRTILATCCGDPKKRSAYEKMGCDLLTLPPKDGYTDLNYLMDCLGKMKIDSILLEGGSTLGWSALNQGIVNKVQAYIAPKLFGGQNALTPAGGTGVDLPDQAFLLETPEVTVLGRDILLESGVLMKSSPSDHLSQKEGGTCLQGS